jgi:hypothetical protein
MQSSVVAGIQISFIKLLLKYAKEKYSNYNQSSDVQRDDKRQNG